MSFYVILDGKVVCPLVLEFNFVFMHPIVPHMHAFEMKFRS